MDAEAEQLEEATPNAGQSIVEEGSATAGGEQAAAAAKLSKSQMKKLAKRQKYLEHRKERRKLEKDKKKAKRKEHIRQLAESGQPIQNEKNKIKPMRESANKYRVVIDMDFNEYMTDNEMAKAAKQVGRIYAINRHSDNPCQLYISSLAGKIKERFELTNRNYENWDVNCSSQDYLSIFADEKIGTQNCDTQEPASNITSKESKSKFIYLTGDTDETLPSVDEILKDESTIFVIGGLVDHNRHKSLCYRRATEKGIKAAKLPIKENNVQLCQRHILSTVTVFEILLNVLCYHKQWPEALMGAIPKRKLTAGSSELDNGLARNE